ncbi:MAG: glycosyltransferase family 39 protein [bacterium]|nr:glycosyltransferase family 39 protein [Candidatus Sumerlaeota bacterium]
MSFILFWASGRLLLDWVGGIFGLNVSLCPTSRWPAGAITALALTLGMGLAGFVFELMAMARLLSRWQVAAAWLVMITVLWLLRNRRKRHKIQACPLAQTHLRHSGLEHSSAAANPRRHALLPAGVPARCYYIAALVACAVICFLVSAHAIAFPETYWDSLILYVAHGRRIFEQHGFPYKVVGQVGIGLGANYPHLYSLLAAQTAALAGEWNDVYAQTISPAACIASALLVHATALDLTRDRIAAISAVLLFLSVPYGIAYFQYATTYSVAILFTAAFIYLLFKYVSGREIRHFALMMLVAAFAVHINYLMWILWVAAAAGLAVTFVGSGNPRPITELPRVLLIMVIALLLASPWHIRNTIVTGNPVYAFFNNIFPGIHVNPAVMRSAETEWLLNGDGLGRAGRALSAKIVNSWSYFVTGPQHWKLAPVFMAFAVPGFVVSLMRVLGWSRRRWRTRKERIRASFGCACATLFVLLWFYAYVIADYYLYQVIIVLPLFGVYSCYVFDICRTRPARTVLCALCLVIGITPGITMALMGFKLKKGGEIGGMPYSQIGLTALHNPFLDRTVFYRMEYGADMDIFARLERMPAAERLLTHENRHLLLNKGPAIIHLDDWEVQPAYGQRPEQRIAILDALGIGYYLYVPNEDNHAANSWLGVDELIGLGYFKEEYRGPASRSSMRKLVRYKNIPADFNVLYKRVRP